MKLPTPPKDLWAQMDAVREDCRLAAPPPNAFTSTEYAERYGITRDNAYKEIQRLVAAGRVRKLDTCHKHYYELVN